jgi:hypothetical protein
MGFRENLLKKIDIDRTAEKVAYSMGPPDSGRRIDKALARRMLAGAGYEMLKKRDLELYLRPMPSGTPQVLVLDNDLPIYATSPDDVALRKSPVVKEMVSIRNVIRILNDSDVLVSKKGESVETLRQDCVAGLDLAFSRKDIEEIEQQGAASLENSYPDGVLEALDLFAELLAYSPPPKPLRLAHHRIIGAADSPRGLYGPMALYDKAHNHLKWIGAPVRLTDRTAVETVHAVAGGDIDPALEGPSVFTHLTTTVMEKRKAP